MDDKKENKKYLLEFSKAMDDDLNTPLALQVLWKLARDSRAEGKIETIKKIDSVFGLRLLEKEKIEIPNEIKSLADDRELARKKKDWGKSDLLREKLNKKGWLVDDTEEGYRLRKI